MAKFVTYYGDTIESLDATLTKATAGRTDFQVLRHESDTESKGYMATLVFMGDNGHDLISQCPLEERRLMEINNFHFLSRSYGNQDRAALDLGYKSLADLKEELQIE